MGHNHSQHGDELLHLELSRRFTVQRTFLRIYREGELLTVHLVLLLQLKSFEDIAVAPNLDFFKLNDGHVPDLLIF